MARQGFRSFRLTTVLGALALAALPLGVVRQASAGDPPRADARAAAAAAAIETANLRAKTKLELARILDREGRTEEAMAALLEADRILVDSARLAAELAGTVPPPSRPTPAPVPVPSPRPPSSGAKPLFPGPVVPGPESRPVAPRLQPRRDPVPSAVLYLLSKQGFHGAFDGAEGGNDGSERAQARTVAVTSWALLALAEVATGDAFDEASKDLADRAAAAAGRAAGFLLASAKDDGALAPTTEDHCVAGWAVASALSRLGPRLVTSMPKELGITTERLEKGLGAALRRALLAADPDTGLLRGVGTGDARFLGTLAFLGFLHEVEPLPLAKALAADGTLARAREKATVGLSVGPVADERPKTAAGRAALALLRRDRTGLDTAADGKVPTDPTHLLYGTVAAGSLGAEPEWEAWWQEVLVPAMEAQVADGVEAGSFPPAGDPLGRTHATALSLLAWLYPDMEWRAPAAGN